jgi:hypothetical protein
MDVNLTLEQLRKLSDDIRHGVEYSTLFDEMANTFLELDSYLSKGGMLPASWSKLLIHSQPAPPLEADDAPPETLKEVKHLPIYSGSNG